MIRNIDLDLPFPPHPHEGLGFQKPEDLRLEERLHISDLIEKNGSPVGQLKKPLLRILGIGEGSLFISEELRFQEGIRDGTAVDFINGRWLRLLL